MYIELKPEIDDALDTMEGLIYNEKSIRGKVLSKVATKGKGAAKRSYKSVLNKQSGHLYSTIRRYVYKNKRAAVVTAHDREDKVRYGFMLAHGYNIEPKNKDFLTFKIGEKWVRYKGTITVQPKDFIETPVKRYLDSNECIQDMDAVIQKQIDKIEAKQNIQ